MVRHIVFMKLNPGSEREHNLHLLKTRIDQLVDLVPGIAHLETGINFSTSPAASDLVLVSEFNNRSDLNAYRNHPEHLNVVSFLKTVVTETRVVDYEFEPDSHSLPSQQ